MIFTEKEIRRLEELASWGIQKGITDEDLKSAQKKLKKLLSLQESSSIVVEDPANVYDPAAMPGTLEKTVTLMEKMLGRPIIPAEARYINAFIDAGAGYELIRYAILETNKAVGSPNLVLTRKVLEKELGKTIRVDGPLT